MATTNTGTLTEWGALWAGNWNLQSATVGEGGVFSTGSGNHKISWMPGNGALEGVCIPPFDAQSAGVRWVATNDPTSGAIKQVSVGADGTVMTAYITKPAGGEWSWVQTCVFASGVTETNTSTFTVSNGGNTITQHIGNRTLTGATQPLSGYAPSATPAAPPRLADVCTVATKA